CTPTDLGSAEGCGLVDDSGFDPILASVTVPGLPMPPPAATLAAPAMRGSRTSSAGENTACTIPLIDNCFPFTTLSLSKTTVSCESESPLDRAFAAATCPASFDPFGTRVPSGNLKLPTVSTSTASPSFTLLESRDLVSFTGNAPCPTAFAAPACVDAGVAASL